MARGVYSRVPRGYVLSDLRVVQLHQMGAMFVACLVLVLLKFAVSVGLLGCTSAIAALVRWRKSCFLSFFFVCLQGG